MHPAARTVFVLAAALACGAAAMAQSVALSGMLGGKALVMVDGGAPKTVAAGDSYKGVKIISTQGDVAVVEIAGKRHTLRVGDAPSSVGSSGGTAQGSGSGTKVVLTAGQNGHFFAQGQINGQAVHMMVDTGASMVGLSQADADRMGIAYKTGQSGRVSTANGVIQAWRVKLDSVRVGDVVVYGVDGVVSAGSMPYILLGNSFLGRFQMTRTNDQMVLDKRY